MMNFIRKNSVAVLVVLLAVLGLVVYFNFFSGETTQLLGTANQEVSPVSPDLLATLTNLHTIRLDTTIFNDPTFLSLTSFGVELSPEAVGRRNPFLPVGSQ